MYRGCYTVDAICGDHEIVRDEKEEKNARKRKFVDGHEFFSHPPVSPEELTAISFDNVYQRALEPK